MKQYFDKGKNGLLDLSRKLPAEITGSLKVFQEVVAGLPIFSSTERSDNFVQSYDEKHYFVIPYKLSQTGFTLHTMRCLPDDAPEVNDLPKRRVFHFPNSHYEGSLRKFMVESALELSQERGKSNKSTLERLADDIDKLDRKLTLGLLLVGGVAAVFNPLIGAGLAAKAVLPGVSGVVNKFGLRPVGEKLSELQGNKMLRQAEEEVAKQFSESNTLKVINPILQELELALRTTEAQHDPLTDPNLADGSIPELDSERWRELTARAVYHVYKDIYLDKKQANKAQLGPEDLRWFEVLFAGVK
ncbi:hypothetical protein [Microbulbifer variabilis]|uniref:hypothetical protein n=1 Tax=Microbulbifer variabilis TaxID=266805 RepID=UPI001CFC58F6|nr:hypothetical protein [Microbulbifer variabilis]